MLNRKRKFTLDEVYAGVFGNMKSNGDIGLLKTR